MSTPERRELHLQQFLAVARSSFQNTQAHVRDLKANDQLIKKWDDNTYTQTMQAGGNRSYLAEWANTTDYAATGNDPQFQAGKGMRGRK